MNLAEDTQAIRDLIEAWMQATAEGNVEAVLDLVAEDAVFLRAGQPPLKGREAFGAATRSAMEQGKIEGRSIPQEIQVFGNFASCWSQLEVRYIPVEGPSQKREGPVLSLFRREPDGRWVLFRDANMLSGA
jgi:uncharacterized protein (TIGR02246 family)